MDEIASTQRLLHTWTDNSNKRPRPAGRRPVRARRLVRAVRAVNPAARQLSLYVTKWWNTDGKPAKSCHMYGGTVDNGARI